MTPMAAPPQPAPAYGGFPPFPIGLVERRLNALGVAWLVYAGMAALTGLIGLAFLQQWVGGHSAWGNSFGRHFGAAPFAPFFLWRFAGVTLGIRVLLAAAAGIGLLQKTSWGRWVAIVAAILAVLHFPFGTGIAIWSLVVLLNATNTAGYHMLARD